MQRRRVEHCHRCRRVVGDDLCGELQRPHAGRGGGVLPVDINGIALPDGVRERQCVDVSQFFSGGNIITIAFDFSALCRCVAHYSNRAIGLALYVDVYASDAQLECKLGHDAEQ